MNLYCITTGYTGESYVRCYVWAESATQATIMFHEKYPNQRMDEIGLLFSENDKPFITWLSDSGWER